MTLALAAALIGTGAATTATAAEPAPASRGAGAATTSPSSDFYVTAVYRDLFGRGVDSSGLSTWTAALASGVGRIVVANSITYSNEYRTGLITQTYQRFLGRSPEPAGLSAWLGAMQAGLTIEQMEGGFLASTESFQKAGSNPTGWVTGLYQSVLGRVPSSPEISGWTSAMAQGASRSDIARGFLLSSERLSTVIDTQYQLLLGRSIDPTGRTFWVRAIQSGTRLEAVIGGIVASDEYYVRNGGVVAAAPSPAPSAPAVATSPPPEAGRPGPSNTGVPAGVTLRPSGSLTITQPGAVIDGLEITGTVTVNADNVTIRNSRIKNTGDIPVRNNGANLVIEDTEIDGQGQGNPAVAYNKYTLRRVNIHNVAEGPRIAGGNVVIENSYIHHLVQVGSNHTDAIQIVSGKENIVIRNNNIQAFNPSTGVFGNAALQFGEEDGIVRGCVVEGNLMNGGNLTVNGGGGGTTGAACSFSDNEFQRNFRYGIKGNLGPNTSWSSNNRWFDTQAAV